MEIKYTQLQAEIIYILENEKLGAMPRWTNWTCRINATSEATYTFVINKQSYWKINKIKMSGPPDTFYITIVIDGRVDKDNKPTFERQILREDNSQLEFKTPILARDSIYIKVENTDLSPQTFSITIEYTEYDKNVVDNFRKELGF